MAEKGEQRVESVERALSILEAWSQENRPLTLNELAQRTGYYRSTILRLAASLQRFGYLQRDAEGYFRLGPSLFRLGALYQQSFNLADHVRPMLARLVDETGETSSFYVRDGDKRICLLRHHSPRIFRHHLEEGAELSLDRGASAHILMAFSDEPGAFYDAVRAQGFFISEGERDPETLAVAVPVLGPHRRLIGAMGVVGQIGRITPDQRDRMLSHLQTAGRDLSRQLGWTP